MCHIEFILLDEVVFSKCAVLVGGAGGWNLWTFMKHTLFHRFIVQIIFILLCNVGSEQTLFYTPPPEHQLCFACIPKFDTLCLSSVCVFLDLPTLLDLNTLMVFGGRTNIIMTFSASSS
jgi:hypothetical protein